MIFIVFRFELYMSCSSTDMVCAYTRSAYTPSIYTRKLGMAQHPKEAFMPERGRTRNVGTTSSAVWCANCHQLDQFIPVPPRLALRCSPVTRTTIKVKYCKSSILSWNASLPTSVLDRSFCMRTVVNVFAFHTSVGKKVSYLSMEAF